MLSEARGLSRLAVDAVTGIADISEDLHRTILGLAPVVGRIPPGTASGLTGLVYRSVRAVARAAGAGIEGTLSALDLQPASPPSFRHEALRAVLNGVLGDHLESTGNPLAIPMGLRHRGRDLTDAPLPKPGRAGHRLMVMVHGLCMNDLQWAHEGHDPASALARRFGFTPLFLRYNSGLPIERNGERLAALLDELLQRRSGRVEELVIICHSMGGLVTQAAWRHADAGGLGWPTLTSCRFYLGSPLLGAPLERSGEWFNSALGTSPYLAPFTRLGNLRSRGIKDLRHGIVVREGNRSMAMRGLHLLAASRRAGPGPRLGLPPGDGLVPVESALGRSGDARIAFELEEGRRAVVRGCGHLGLLRHPRVYDRLARWMRQR